MIHCLIGHSSSGKTTIEKLLGEIGIKRIASYTTRPRRKGETDGVDYHFISTRVFKEMKEQGKFAETAMYRDWFYGISLEDIDYKNTDYVAVCTISGYQEILKLIGEEHVNSIFIKADERVRLHRLVKRGDDLEEIYRRIKVDREDFHGVELICDYIVENNNDSILEPFIETLNIVKVLNKISE